MPEYPLVNAQKLQLVDDITEAAMRAEAERTKLAVLGMTPEQVDEATGIALGFARVGTRINVDVMVQVLRRIQERLQFGEAPDRVLAYARRMWGGHE